MEVDLGDLTDLVDGEMRAVEAGDLDVVVCRVNGELYAIEDLCSHAESTLSDGLLTGYVVTCPLHGARFDVRDGTHQGPPAFEGVRSWQIVEGEASAVVNVAETEEKGDGFGAPGGLFRTR